MRTLVGNRMTEKRYVAIPETVSYKDTATDEILCLKVEKDYYEVLSLLNHFHDAWFDVHEGLEQISKEYDELHKENQLLKQQIKEYSNIEERFKQSKCSTCKKISRI